MPHLKPVGHQSTNWMVRLVLMVATAAFTSFGTTSPWERSRCCPFLVGLHLWEHFLLQFLKKNSRIRNKHVKHDVSFRSKWCLALGCLNWCHFLQVSAVHHAAGHVFSMTRITLHHHGSWFKDRHGNFCYWQLLMISLLRRDHRRIGGQHEVNTWVRHQVGLEP